MNIYKTRLFDNWARGECVNDQSLCKVVAEMDRGLVGDILGKNLHKKRVAINDRGKSGGLRTIIAYKVKDGAFFMYGFPKNQRDNISKPELQAFKKLAKQILSHTPKDLSILLKKKEIIEVNCDE